MNFRLSFSVKKILRIFKKALTNEKVYDIIVMSVGTDTIFLLFVSIDTPFFRLYKFDDWV